MMCRAESMHKYILPNRITATAALLLLTASVNVRSQRTPRPRPEGASHPVSQKTLRIRLELNPHDASAHKQLIEILRKEDSFRSLVMEDAAWIKNNPDD